jgi:catechol 2,3-dioxygenase-like lactoylglutathione lyase family enzyme
MKLLNLFLATLVVGLSARAETPAVPVPLFRAYGVKINAPDLAAAEKFYREFIGFAVAERAADGSALTLRTDERHYTHVTLVRQAHTGHVIYRRDAHTSFTVQVGDVRERVHRAQREGVRLMENHVRIEQVGLAVTVADPAGNTLSLMDLARKPSPPEPDPAVYNFGFVIPMNGYAQARAFWCDRLGMVTLMDRYLPFDQALFSADKRWGFMLHMRDGVLPALAPPYPGYADPIVQLVTPDLPAAVEKLRAAGAELLLTEPRTDAFGRRYTAFREPFGIPVELLEIRD